MKDTETIVVTGGAGFIGSAVVRYLIAETQTHVVTLDKLTYAGNLSSLGDARDHPRHHFEQVDICDQAELRRIFSQYRPKAVMHLAAESHVDRSIDGPFAFVNTNIVGTYNLLERTHEYWSQLSPDKKDDFRFLHISTDEVFGSLSKDGLFTEESRYDPSSPYSATKASADHLVRAWYRTYGVPVLLSNCSNNYGPYQFPEKLIPLMVLNAIENKPLPVYGAGENIRDWLYVEDHVSALYLILNKGRIGESYNVGAYNERTNLQVVQSVCDILDELKPCEDGRRYASLIKYVEDRPGHDFRYAIDANKITEQLGWRPKETFEAGLKKTVQWYLQNLSWCSEMQRQGYDRERLGLVNVSR